MHNPSGRYHAVTDLAAEGRHQWTAPYGYVAPASGMAMAYTEYQQRYGARREDMATQAVQVRANAQRVPHAYWHGIPLTFDDYMQARMISEPICLYDCDIPVDGGGSFIVTTAERARDLPHRPVHVMGWAKNRNAPPMLPGCLGRLEPHHERGRDLARRLWSGSGLGPDDCSVVELYDGFGIYVWYWLEALGYCEPGEGWRFVQDGRIAPDGARPLNLSGGNQGWGRLHGVPQIAECYLQLAGRAGGRQVNGAEVALATYGTPGDFTGEAWLFSTDPA
jgi:acetyl-CoA acetyltransferase